ncbi:MAG TPA: preprotein translocase subunit SecG [Candidatus Cloacimonadota bacterium]|nr:preprotein translocase subunit SecG [Candidatus Cloacimonadota bacterium]HPT71998.1 preprotein translocase subunit SecG [Candidatus Cloacimonadota bacterium]
MLLFYTLLLVHVAIAVVLILIILAQSSKGGLDSNLGGAAQNVLGGSSGSAALQKWTKIFGGAFLISCIILALTVKHSDFSGSQTPQSSKLFKQLKQTTKPAPVNK